jgi:uncharacterized metal-binding protein YceD (DUF177 family)
VRITIESLPPRGRPLAASKTDLWALSATTSGLGVEPTSVDLDVTIYRLDPAVRVRGSAKATFDTSCHRCTAPVTVDVGGDLDLLYKPHATAQADLELEVDDMDVGFYDGRGLEMDAVLTEYFALQLPDVLRCDSPNVRRIGGPGACALPVQAPGPDLKRRNPFAGIVLPE